MLSGQIVLYRGCLTETMPGVKIKVKKKINESGHTICEVKQIYAIHNVVLTCGLNSVYL